MILLSSPVHLGNTHRLHRQVMQVTQVTPEEHAANLDIVLSRLHEHQFFCIVEKCQFAIQDIKYLGHVVTADTVKPDPHKVEVLGAWPSADIQQSTNNIRSFLGLAGYLRRFIPKFPTLDAPLLERISSK